MGNATTDNAPNSIMELHNPAKTQGVTYTAVRKIFDNYTLKDNEPEVETEDESEEVDAFLDAIMPTEVIQHTRKYINDNRLVEESLTDASFRALIKRQWFTLYDNHFNESTNRQVSGFEHVFVGDQSRSRSSNTTGGIGGHHFWWKFLLDQQAGTADSVGHHYRYRTDSGNSVTPPGERYRWLATFGMRWRPQSQDLYSSKKGFFVGCSPEFMIAHGTVALLIEQKTTAHPTVVLDNGTFELVIHASTQLDGTPGDQIRSVFPALKSVNATAETITVAEAKNVEHGADVAVRGIVTEAFNNQFGLKLTDESDASVSLVVKLDAEFREEFSPLRNPDIVGTVVVAHGKRGNYSMADGLREVFLIEKVAN